MTNNKKGHFTAACPPKPSLVWCMVAKVETPAFYVTICDLYTVRSTFVYSAIACSFNRRYLFDYSTKCVFLQR
jgi:hypothetical protein